MSNGARSYPSSGTDQAKRHTKAASAAPAAPATEDSAPKKTFGAQLLHKFYTLHPQLFHTCVRYRIAAARRGVEWVTAPTSVIKKVCVFLFVWLAIPCTAAPASDAMLLRLYLTDGSSIVSYGEFARVGEQVIVSMVMSGADEPRLHAATLPASAIDWMRTDLHAASARYQWYARTRGEDDFRRLTDDVASVLNTVVSSKDRARALEFAEKARATLAEWPRQHYGYRQRDVREILAVLDEAISDLRAATGASAFNLSLVADPPDVPLEPLAVLPTAREQIDQALRVAGLTVRPAERVALLQAVLQLLDEAGATIPSGDAAVWRRSAEAVIAEEQTVDARYAEMTRRLMTDATRGAARAQVTSVERVLSRIPREDARLGRRRPEVMQALSASVQGQLDAARRLRLLRDQWAIRRSLYTEYQRKVGAQVIQLVKAQPALESIRRLDGPPPETLLTVQAGLRGGAERLDRVDPPVDLRTAHELLIGAWRFAESAVAGRFQAARTADVPAAWEASSSAAGALLLLSRFQQELRTLLEPPQLQ